MVIIIIISIIYCCYFNYLSLSSLLQEFAVAVGLYLPEETGQPIYTDGVRMLPRQLLVSFWRFIAVTPFGRAQAKASQIRDPLYIYIHHAIATSIAPRGQSRDKVGTTDLFFLYCLLLGRPCDLVGSLVEFFSTAHHRQSRGQLFGGVFVTVLARNLGLRPEDDPLVSDGIPSSPLAAANVRSMKIVAKIPGVGNRLKTSGGPNVAYVPVPLPAADDIPVFLEAADGVPAEPEPQAEPQADDVVHVGPEPPQPPQQQYPRHMYDDLPPAQRLVAEDFDQRLRREERQNRRRWRWFAQCMQNIQGALHLDPLSPPQELPSDDDL